MSHGSTPSFRDVVPSDGWPSLPVLLTAGAPFDRRGAAVPRELSVNRLLCLMAVALFVAFAAVYEVIDASGHRSFVPEAGLALAGLAGLAASYRSTFVQRHFTQFVQALCLLTALWFVVLAAANQFAADYAVGLLFIIPGIGVGYSVSLSRVRPLAFYFAAAVGVVAAVLWLEPQPGIAPGLFVGSLVSISAVTLLVAGARLHAQKRFLDSEERYRAVVEQASDGIYLLDATTLRFLDANPAFQAMVGYPLAELLEHSLVDLVVADRDVFRCRTAQARPGRHAHVAERRLRRKDGTTLCVELRIDRITYGGREVLSVVVHDISLRKQYEAGLIAAKENAEGMARFKSSLLTNMSHEIRTPLSSILGWSAILADEVGGAQREVVAIIEQSGRRLHKTLDAVLELAQLDAHTRQLQPVLLDVAEEVDAALGPWRAEAARKGIDLRFDAAPGRLRAEVDASCLRRIVMHLVDNAVKFTDVGSVTVTVAAEGRDLRLSVRDTGVGIGEAFLPYLFEEFKQESEGLARAHEGNGLGLAITRRLVDLLGGDIEVESRKGEGACFTVTLPGIALAPGAAAEAA